MAEKGDDKNKISEEDKLKELKYRSDNNDNIPKLIATICPEYYAKNPSEINKLKKEGKFWEAVSIAKERSPEAGEKFILSYNSSAEGLEPIYFWILDFLGGDERKVKKIIDNFVSSPGSGHFSEMMGKATRMQEEGMKVMQTIGVLIKSVINIIYDLRQFELRLNDYKIAESKDKDKREAGMLALKQTWLDNVDIKRGNSSIKAMTFSQQGAFVTLLNAFFMAQDETLKDINGNEIDLNDIVKRLLRQRLAEFKEWARLSKYELTKRFNMEKAWLRSQVDSLKLYARWAKPYLQSAEQLRMAGNIGSSSALVKAFNTNIMQLVIRKADGVDVQDAVFSHNLPPGFEKLAEKKLIRKYNACIFVDFKFRGIPQRIDQHYSFGGKSDVIFTGYALTDEEIKEMDKRLEESDVNDALKLVEGVTTGSLKEIEEDIRHFLEDKEDRIGKEEGDKDKEEKKKEEVDDSNPFLALIGKGTFWGKEDKKKDGKKADKLGVYILKKENYAEKVVRQFALANSKAGCFKVYDIYKKAHGMGSVPLDKNPSFDMKDVGVGFKDIL